MVLQIGFMQNIISYFFLLILTVFWKIRVNMPVLAVFRSISYHVH